jgi:hypothetical protein
MTLRCLFRRCEASVYVWTYQTSGDPQNPAKRNVAVRVMWRECGRCKRRVRP